MKIKSDIPTTIPDSHYLLFQFYIYLFLEEEDSMALAEERIRRFSHILEAALKDGYDFMDNFTLWQLMVFFYDDIQTKIEPDKTNINFFPNIDLDSFDWYSFEPKLSITKLLIEKGFLSPDFEQLFDNKFHIGAESRIWDGIPIEWNGDENSIVMFFVLLSFLKMIEKDGKFDTLKHGNRPRRDKKISKAESSNNCGDKKSSSTILTLIYGKDADLKASIHEKDDDLKIKKRNFIINGNGNYTTIYRRCGGIRSRVEQFFAKITENADTSKIPQLSLMRYFVDNHHLLFNNKLCRKEPRDERVDKDIVELISAICKETLAREKAPASGTTNNRRPPLRIKKL
jgi:hypothetical protein